MKYQRLFWILAFLFVVFAAVPFFIADNGLRYVFAGLSKAALTAAVLLVCLEPVRKREMTLGRWRLSRDQKPVLFWALTGAMMLCCAVVFLMAAVMVLYGVTATEEKVVP